MRKRPYYYEIWKEERDRFLSQANVLEKEVKTDGYENHFFMLDGYKVYLPDYLVNSRRFKKYIDGNIIYV